MLPGERDLPRGDRDDADPPRKSERPSESLRRWLRLRGDGALADEFSDPRSRRPRPDPTSFEDRLERIWTGEATEPGQDG